MDTNEPMEATQCEWSLTTKDTECWFFKPMENMQLHLAYLDISCTPRVIFTNTLGHAFEEVFFSDNIDARSFLSTNGFRACSVNAEFMRIFGHPSAVVKYNWYQERVYQP